MLEKTQNYVKPVVYFTVGGTVGAAAKPVYRFLKTNFQVGLKEGAAVDTFVKKGAASVGNLWTAVKSSKFSQGIVNVAQKAVDVIKKPFVELGKTKFAQGIASVAKKSVEVIKKPFVALGQTKLVQNKFVQGVAKFFAKPYVKGALIGAAIAAAVYFVVSHLQNKSNE